MIHKWKISEFGWNGITGVYAICAFINGKSIVLYVGSSKDIGKRLQSENHPYRKLYSNGWMVYVKYKITSDYINLEKQIIKRIHPILNIHHNG